MPPAPSWAIAGGGASAAKAAAASAVRVDSSCARVGGFGRSPGSGGSISPIARMISSALGTPFTQELAGRLLAGRRARGNGHLTVLPVATGAVARTAVAPRFRANSRTIPA